MHMKQNSMCSRDNMWFSGVLGVNVFLNVEVFLIGAVSDPSPILISVTGACCSPSR